MTADFLSYLVANAEFSLYNHLEGNAGKVYTMISLGQVWVMKDASGHPWDLYTFDNQYVYQKLTENGANASTWANPSAYKSFVSKSWPGGGIAWCPRVFTPGAANPPLVTEDSSYQIHTDCATFTTASLGQVQTRLVGPWNPSPTRIPRGDLPAILDTVYVSYQWSNGSVMEENYYARGYGLVKWATSSLVNGVYVQQQTSLYNKIVAGGTPQPVFPCPIP